MRIALRFVVNSAWKQQCMFASSVSVDMNSLGAAHQQWCSSNMPDVSCVTAHLHQLTDGVGFVRLPRLFNVKEIRLAHKIMKDAQHVMKQRTLKNYKLEFQTRLLTEGIFVNLIQHPVILLLARNVLGSNVVLGSIDANTYFASGSSLRQNSKDPYWAVHGGKGFPALYWSLFSRRPPSLCPHRQRANWPANPRISGLPRFTSMQVTLLLDDCTEENGAAAVLPGSQQVNGPIADMETFFRNCVRTTGRAGDAIVSTGQLQQCVMPNRTTHGSRSVITFQYQSALSRPKHSWESVLSTQFMSHASHTLRDLLSLNVV